MASVVYSVPTSLHGEHSILGAKPQAESYSTCSTAGDTPSRRNSTSPGARSRSFSISDILSDDLGSRKRSSSSVSDTRAKQSKVEYESMSPESATLNKTFPSQSTPHALLSPINMYSTLHQQVKGLMSADPLRTQSIPSQVYPGSYPHLMTSPTSSPLPSVSFPSYQPLTPAYSPHIAAATAQMQHYLHMQAAAAVQQRNMMAAVVAVSQQQQHQQQLHDSIAAASTRLHDEASRPKQVVNRQDNSENSADENALHHQISTPILLKNKRKAPMKPSLTPQNTPPTGLTSTPEGPYHHNSGYPKPQYSRSPLKPPNTTFSPSIFLTRPSASSMSHHTPVNTSSPECTNSDREAGPIPANMFMTSTPIRRGESTLFIAPHSHSPISSGQHQSHTAAATSEYQSNGGDSEVPLLRRPRVPRKRTKPRSNTPYGPVMESTSSVAPLSRHTPSHAPPSSLLMSYTAGAGAHHNYSINDSGFGSDTSSHRAQQENVTACPPPSKPHNFNVSSENIYKTPVKNVHSRQQQGGCSVKYPDAWGSSPFTDHLKKTGRIQSIPPWFVCSDKRKDGKRLRLTEAINKSLMETPSQTTTHQLPAEWQKYAYGQTEDQKDLTQKARSFLRCRPRVLQFEKASSN